MTMGAVRTFCILAIFLLCSLFYPGGAQGAEFTPADELRLSRGEVLVDATRAPMGSGTRISAAIDVSLPAALVWPVMTDCERAPTFVPGLSSCRVLQRDAGGAWDIREHISSPGWPLPDFRTVFRSTYDPTRSVHFSRVDGDLKRSEGEWLLLPLHGGASTRIVYVAEVEYDTWAPAFILRDHLAAQMRRVLLALQRECTVTAGPEYQHDIPKASASGAS